MLIRNLLRGTHKCKKERAAQPRRDTTHVAPRTLELDTALSLCLCVLFVRVVCRSTVATVSYIVFV